MAVATPACDGDETADMAELSDLRTPPPGSAQFGIFEGRVPCADCERLKLRLTLHKNAQDETPTTYVLERIYVGSGDTRHVTDGRWSVDVATGPDAVVYQLDGATPVEFSRFLPVGHDLLLLLDDNGEPRVGNASHSFTLSRTE